jgi:hypothetical protein
MIIDFDAAKDRRAQREVEADEAEWNAFRNQLVATMMTTSMQNSALVTATLNALFQVLERSNLSLEESKALITTRLKIFF